MYKIGSRGCNCKALSSFEFKSVQSVISSATRPLPTRQKKRKGQKPRPETHAVNALTTTLPHALALGVVDVSQPRPQVPRELFRRATEDVEDSTGDGVGGDGAGLVGFVHLCQS
jgi:hypothetical protein